MFTTTRRTRKSTFTFPYRLNFYAVPPREEISVEDLENLARKRLHLLKALEAATLRKRSEEEQKTIFSQAESEYLPLHANNVPASLQEEERCADNTSHFILRLAYACTRDLTEWFIRYEVLLFRFRMEREQASERAAFLTSLRLNVKEANEPNLMSDLLAATGASEGERFFKVHFTQVLPLVATRKCLLLNGMAYIAGKDILALAESEFKSHLQQQMELTSRYLPRMEEDERLLPVLNGLTKQYVGDDYKSTEKVACDDIESLLVHFPPCMRHLHDALVRDSHLRHLGRLQYGLFLKGIGLGVDEALLFWKRKFSNINDLQFSKNYAYNVRYNYGLEGKRANYTPYSCGRILANPMPSVNEHHGCPFKSLSKTSLRDLVVKYGGETEAAAIVEFAEAGHYQIACTKFLETTRPRKDTYETVEHPNQYYLQSQNRLRGEDRMQD